MPKIVHSAKNCLPNVFILPSVFCGTLGKDLICRVPETIHSAKVEHSANLNFPVVINDPVDDELELEVGGVCFSVGVNFLCTKLQLTVRKKKENA